MPEEELENKYLSYFNSDYLFLMILILVLLFLIKQTLYIKIKT